ncbi:MAG: STAS domain-containing protein [Rhodospirillaceae bacterium]
METVVTTFLGNRLRVDLERMTTPSGMVVTNLRPAGPLVTAERDTIVAAMAAAGGLESQFMVLDTSEADQVDHTGLGEILLLSGLMRLANRHFSLVVGEGVVADTLRRYGVLEIVKARQPGGDAPDPSYERAA